MVDGPRGPCRVVVPFAIYVVLDDAVLNPV
jgi:hypothetical protein